MYEDNLPAGASDDSNAPYNQRDLGTACANKKVYISLSNIVSIETHNVVEDEDEDGKCIVPADDVDWKMDYLHQERTPLHLFGVLISMCENKIRDLEGLFKDDPKTLKEMTAFYKEIAEACKDWQIDEIDIDDI